MIRRLAIMSLGSVVALLGGIFGLSPAQGVLIQHNGTTIFFDDFESAPTVVADITTDFSDANPVPVTGNGWLVQEDDISHLQVVSDSTNTAGPAFEGNNFMHIRTDSTSSTDPRLRAQFNSVTGGSLSVEFMYRNNNIAAGTSELQVTYFDPSGFFGVFSGPAIRANDLGQFVAFESGVTVITPTGLSVPQDQNWHRIKIDADLDTGLYGFALDGVATGTFNSGATNITVSEIWLAPAGFDTVGINPRFDIDAIPSSASVPGDFDGDGDVDGADFVVWQTNFPKAEGGTLATGDADSDGDVDGADFVVWQTNFPFTPGGAASPVPEPSSVLLALVAAFGIAISRIRCLSPLIRGTF